MLCKKRSPSVSRERIVQLVDDLGKLSSAKKLEVVRAVIASMTDDERVQVMNALAIHGTIKPVASEPIQVIHSDDELDVAKQWYEVLRQESLNAFGRSELPWSVFKRTSTCRIFIVAALETEKWLRSHIANPIHQGGWRIIIAGLVVGEVRKSGSPMIPLWNQLAAILRYAPVLVDRAFPGYVASGLLNKVVVSWVSE
jgi:hypothetical protein